MNLVLLSSGVYIMKNTMVVGVGGWPPGKKMNNEDLGGKKREEIA